MWFRMSYNLLYSNLFADVMTPRGKGDRPECRLLLLIQMLCASSDGATFESAGHLSKRFCVNMNNAQIVWDSCLKHNALIQAPNGSFTMYEWMIEQGIVGKADKTKRVTSDTKDVQPTDQVLERLKKVRTNGR